MDVEELRLDAGDLGTLKLQIAEANVLQADAAPGGGGSALSSPPPGVSPPAPFDGARMEFEELRLDAGDLGTPKLQFAEANVLQAVEIGRAHV